MATTTEKEITVAGGLGNADASKVLAGTTFSSENGFNLTGTFVPLRCSISSEEPADCNVIWFKPVEKPVATIELELSDSVDDSAVNVEMGDTSYSVGNIQQISESTGENYTFEIL